MKITALFQDDPNSEQEITVGTKLGHGKFDVFHAKSFSLAREYAIKIYPKEDPADTNYRREKAFLALLDHPNIIKSYPLMRHDTDFNILVMEYAPYGEFFEIVTKKGLEHEVHMRTYFHQLIAGLEYMHSKSVAHLDLKLDNLLLGQDYNLKIIDFDGSQMKTEKRPVYTGTNCYRAPEVLDKTCVNRFAADVYAAGIILFAFKACSFPFAEIEENGKTKMASYDVFVNDNEKFWKNKTKELGKKSDFFSKDFKKLLKGMLAKDPSKRMTIDQIKASEWFNKPILCSESLRDHMSTVLRRIIKDNVKENSKF